MSGSHSRDNITVRIYRKGRETLDDMVFVILLLFVLLGFSAHLLKHCLK